MKISLRQLLIATTLAAFWATGSAMTWRWMEPTVLGLRIPWVTRACISAAYPPVVVYLVAFPLVFVLDQLIREVDKKFRDW